MESMETRLSFLEKDGSFHFCGPLEQKVHAGKHLLF